MCIRGSLCVQSPKVLGLPMEVDVMSVPAQVKSEYFNGEKVRVSGIQTGATYSNGLKPMISVLS